MGVWGDPDLDRGILASRSKQLPAADALALVIDMTRCVRAGGAGRVAPPILDRGGRQLHLAALARGGGDALTPRA